MYYKINVKFLHQYFKKNLFNKAGVKMRFFKFTIINQYLFLIFDCKNDYY